jgi:hypothetical protein
MLPAALPPYADPLTNGRVSVRTILPSFPAGPSPWPSSSRRFLASEPSGLRYHGADCTAAATRRNSALWRVGLVRMHCHQPTKDYGARRTAEGRTKKEILRCLNR